MEALMMLAMALQTAPPEDKEECRKILDAFHAAGRSGSEAARVEAIQVLSKHHCVHAIAALAPLLSADSDKVRIAAAKALGGMDHPKALEALTQALPANENPRPVFEAVVKALQTLDWQGGAGPLDALLAKYHEKGMIDELRVVLPALGSLKSADSVDPLIRLLEHAENEGKAGRAGKVRSAGNPKLVALEGPVKSALQAITGGSEPNHQKWKEWWQANRERLLESAVVVYYCTATGKRWEQKAGTPESCPNHEKPEKDGVVVKVRINPRG